MPINPVPAISPVSGVLLYVIHLFLYGVINSLKMLGNNSGTVEKPIDDHSIPIKDVWSYDLHKEFFKIRQVVQKYHWIAMDTEFPGVVAKPDLDPFMSSTEHKYEVLRTNVNLLSLIQLGLTFMDENGNTPPGCNTWQFNFKFSLETDLYAEDSIDMLINSGLRFRDHEMYGIDPSEFAELLMSSGIVLMDNVRWLSFHSGYDFGYLLKILTARELPLEESDFLEYIRLYFRNVYDVKHLMKLSRNLRGGLQDVAAQLEICRIGTQHQAGSDALLTGMAFFKIKEIFFEGDDIYRTSGQLYGFRPPIISNRNIFLDSSWKPPALTN